MNVVEMSLEGKAEIWYHSMKVANGNLGWDEFSVSLCRRFGNQELQDEVEKFNKLQQTGTIR